jgi:uncharacterized damage-inducible protein DinB
MLRRDKMHSLIINYANGYQSLLDAIHGLSDEELSFKPTPKSWSIKEILVHIADAELVGIHRMKKVLSEENPLLTDYNQDLWANRLDYTQLDYQQYLALFKLLRESFIPVLNRLTEEDMLRTGIHTEVGKLTLKDLLQNYINHINDHLKQIQRVRDAFGKK